MASTASTASTVSSATRAGAGGAPASASSASSSSSGTKNELRTNGHMFGIALSVLGGLGVVGAVAAQAFAIDHGSNQKPIDANNITTVWSIIIGVILLVVGVVFYFHFETVGGEYKYLYAYGLAFSSYIVATVALYMSTIQVIVRESTN
jgi:hypothetical protein